MTEAKSNSISSLILEREINAPIEKVFQAWTQPELIAAWFSPAADFSVSVPILDLKIGGSYRIEMINPDGETCSAIGEYLEITEPDRLVFTWSWDGGDSGMLVTIDLSESAGKTSLRLTHEKFPDDSSREQHNEGWLACLDRLQTLFS